MKVKSSEFINESLDLTVFKKWYNRCSKSTNLGDYMSVQFFNGIPVSIPNEISKDAPDFYISYNQSSSDYGTDTTAIYIKSTGQFLILAGNHTEQYAGLDFEQVLEYFYNNVSKAVKQSEHGIIFQMTGGKAAYVNGGY